MATKKRWWRGCCTFSITFLLASIQGLNPAEGERVIRSTLMIQLPVGFEGLITSSDVAGGAWVSGREDMLIVSHNVSLPAPAPGPSSAALCYVLFAEVVEGPLFVNKVCSVTPRPEGLLTPIHLYATMAMPEHPGTITYDLRSLLVSTDEVAASLMVPVLVDRQGPRHFLIPWHAEDAQLDLEAMATGFCQDLGIPDEQACAGRVVSQYKARAHAAFLTPQPQAQFEVLLIDPTREPEDWTLLQAVNIVINSNCRFFNTSSGRILGSLLNAGWPADQIWFIVGGCPEESTFQDPSGYHIQRITEDLIDFSAFSVLCHWLSGGIPPPTYWFYVHDTMEAGASFLTRFLSRLELLQRAWGGHFPYAALTSISGKSMNIGIFLHDYLRNEAPYFDREVARPLRELGDAYSRKAKGAELEDWFLTPMTRVMTLNQRMQVEAVDVYGQGVGRRVLHYPGLDLYKYQANFFVEEGGHFKTDL